MAPIDTAAADETAASIETADSLGRFELLRSALLTVVERHDPDAACVLRGEPSGTPMNMGVLARTIQAQAVWFQLLGIAEQNRDMRRRREVERLRGHEQVQGTFAHVFRAVADQGLGAAQVRDALCRLRIRPVITAHPTETRRVTVLERYRRIYLRLYDLESPRWTTREREALHRAVTDEIELLWLTGELKLDKPTVEQEVEWGLYFFHENLFDVVPQLYARIEAAFARQFPGESLELPVIFSFGSWIGGDRDGNPYVTSEATRNALWRMRLESLRRYDERLLDLARNLSVSERVLDLASAFRAEVAAALASSGQGDAIAARNPGELLRQFIAAMRLRLRCTTEAAERREATPDAGYLSADQLIADLQAMHKALSDAGAGALAQSFVAPLLCEVRCFRFVTARLDVRENSDRIRSALADIYRLTHDGQTPPEPESAQWKEWLLAELAAPIRQAGGRHAAADCGRPWHRLEGLGPEAAETLGTFRAVAEMRLVGDRECVGVLILSMTRCAADVLGTYLLAKHGGLFNDAAAVERSALQVVPLLESINDLRRAGGLLKELLDVPLVQRTLHQHGNVQEVMVGYSDSNKDGGFFAASWELFKAQAEMTRLGNERGIKIAFFHGRGGSVSRGGSPTGRAVAALPAGTISGAFRVTEQGETVASKYAHRGTAHYQAELLASSVLQHVLMSQREAALEPRHEFDEAMEAIAGMSFAAYRRLIDLPQLLSYLQGSSPLEELALLNLGSRPSRRTRANTLADLRAIPWVFAWTQNRHMVPGWYGLGSGLEAFVEVRRARGLALLQRMFNECRLFRTVIDEVEKTLLTVDLEIARGFSDLVADPAVRTPVFDTVAAEYHRTCRMVLEVADSGELAERFPQHRRRLSRRLQTMNQVSREQMQLLQRQRAGGGDDVRTALLLSLHCAAAGLGTTG